MSILKDIRVADDVLAQLQETLLSDKGRQEEITAHQSALKQKESLSVLLSERFWQPLIVVTDDSLLLQQVCPVRDECDR
jgi:hypothetical protein